MDKNAVKASVIVVTYNNAGDIEECLTSLLGQTYDDYEVVVVDNASTDGTADLVEKFFPSVRLIRNTRNVGLTKANNLGARYSESSLVVFLNPDTKVEPDWLQQLVLPLQTWSKAGLSTSKILLYNTERIDACGLKVHYTGFAFCNGIGDSSSVFSKIQGVDSVSGAAYAMRREVFEELGGLDDDLFYSDDVDISWRARLMGFQVVLAPDSIVYHKHNLSIPPKKFYFLEKNRLIIVLKNYSLKTLLRILPALVLAEILSWGFAVLEGGEYPESKIQTYLTVLRNARGLVAKRRKVQSQRRVSDRDLLGQFSSTLPSTVPMFSQRVQSRFRSSSITRLVNTAFAAHHRASANLQSINSQIRGLEP